MRGLSGQKAFPFVLCLPHTVLIPQNCLIRPLRATDLVLHPQVTIFYNYIIVRLLLFNCIFSLNVVFEKLRLLTKGYMLLCNPTGLPVGISEIFLDNDLERTFYLLYIRNRFFLHRKTRTECIFLEIFQNRLQIFPR